MNSMASPDEYKQMTNIMDMNNMSSYDQPEVVISQPGHPPPAYYSPPQPMMAPSHTTVVVQQQPAVQYMGPRNWSSGICDCFNDCETCLCGLFCHSCLVCSITERLDESCCVPMCVPGGIIALRVKLRIQHNIEGSIMNDCCMAAFCYQCMLCQMKRELKFLSRVNMI